MKTYVIRRDLQEMSWGDDFWSDEAGWVMLEGADVFSEDEHKTLVLPFDGYWVELPSQKR